MSPRRPTGSTPPDPDEETYRPNLYGSAGRRFRPAVLRVVRAIPAGRVASYGQVAQLAGFPRRARHVGQVLASLQPGEDVPWHRVLRSDGSIAERGRTGERARSPEHRQARRLRAEGVPVNDGRVPMRTHRWQPGTTDPELDWED